MPSRRDRWRGQRGSGAVLVAGVVGAIAAALIGALAVVSAARASSVARAAADLGALAGAHRLVSLNLGPEPCVAAAQVVHANGARVQECHVLADAVTVVAAVPAAAPAWGQARALARAGPGLPRETTRP